jgi:hypothetical protein
MFMDGYNWKTLSLKNVDFSKSTNKIDKRGTVLSLNPRWARAAL